MQILGKIIASGIVILGWWFLSDLNHKTLALLIACGFAITEFIFTSMTTVNRDGSSHFVGFHKG